MSPVFTSSLFFFPFPDLCQESPLQAARSSWRAKKQAAEEEEEEEEEEGEKEDGRREITAWQQTLQPPPHPIEGSYLQVKCCVVWEWRIMGIGKGKIPSTQAESKHCQRHNGPRN